MNIAIDDCTPWEPRPHPYFNFDFSLEFREDWRTLEWLYTVEAIRPRVMGAGDLFLAVNQADYSPLRLHLTLGHVIPMRYFKPYTTQIEQALIDMGVGDQLRAHGVSSKESKRAVRLKKSAYARVFAIGGELTFCWMVRDPQPTTRGQKLAIYTGERQGEVWCHVDDGQVVCVDGWLKDESGITDFVGPATGDSASCVNCVTRKPKP